MAKTFATSLGAVTAVSPEGVETGNPGDLVTSADGRAWRKATGTGNTGWVDMSVATDNDKVVGSVAALRLLDVTLTSGMATTTGYSTPGDGGGHAWYWDAASTATDNNGTIVKPAHIAALSAGRWLALETQEVFVEWFGADNTGTTDSQSAFQAALLASDRVTAGRGVFRVDGAPVSIGIYQTVRIEHGTQVKRFAASASTDPVFRLEKRGAALVGSGRITSDKNSPKGVVQIGHPNAADTTDILWCQVRDLFIDGNYNAVSVGLCITNNQVALVANGVNYQNVVSGLTITNLTVGVRLEELSNAHSFTDVNFAAIDNGVCYDLVGALENTFKGGFCHLSVNNTIIKLRAGVTYGSNDNVFTGVAAEPGGASARYYDIGAGCSHNLIFGNDNTALGGVDLGTETDGTVSGNRFGQRDGKITYDPVSIPAGEAIEELINVNGTLFGDLILPTFSNDLGRVTLHANVPFDNFIRFHFTNPTAAAVDLPSSTLRWRRIRLKG